MPQETKINVLVVDDEEGMRETLGDVLEDEGYDVVLAKDGYTAIQKIKQILFSIIFMDIRMPGMDGIETFKQIKKIAPRTPVILMTAYAKEDLISDTMREGVHAIIYKPFEVDKIIDNAQRLLKRTPILIVDDRLEYRKVLKDILEYKGYQVTTAKNGHKAVKAVQEKHFDIIFMDVKMPGMGGAEAFEEIKKIDTKTTVIMMSGYLMEDAIRKTLKNGAYAAIYKPFDPTELIKIVDGIQKHNKK